MSPGAVRYDFGLGTELIDGIDDAELERKQTSAARRECGRLGQSSPFA